LPPFLDGGILISKNVLVSIASIFRWRIIDNISPSKDGGNGNKTQNSFYTEGSSFSPSKDGGNGNRKKDSSVFSTKLHFPFYLLQFYQNFLCKKKDALPITLPITLSEFYFVKLSIF
jgi:hypothetical protein